MAACDKCARRSWLVGRLAGNLEQIRGNRPAVRGVLALSDRRLIAAIGGKDSPRILSEWLDFDAGAERARWQSHGCSALCQHDPSFPPGISALSDPPAVLHLASAPSRFAELLHERSIVAIVGARRASADGLELARELGRSLSLSGVTVVSGMALGIDSAAHEGALEGDAKTLAVLACGPEQPYPKRRCELHAELVANSAVISELPPTIAPYRWAFPARNRIIAALAQMTVVVEAAERSGSLITAEIAADLGRAVGAAPGHPSSWHAAGTNSLLRDGAAVVRDVRDVLDDVCGVGTRNVDKLVTRPRPLPEGLSEQHLSVISAIEDGYVTAASIADYCQQDGDLLAPLTELELSGVLRRRPDGSYVRH